jgi:hypothetical protein
LVPPQPYPEYRRSGLYPSLCANKKKPADERVNEDHVQYSTNSKTECKTP